MITTRLGTDDIVTNKGDYIGTIPDEDWREYIIKRINENSDDMTLVTEEEKMMLTSLEEEGINDLIELESYIKRHEQVINKIDETIEGVKELLSNAAVEDNEHIAKIYETIKQLLITIKNPEVQSGY